MTGGLRLLAREQRGAALTEFGLLAPVLMILLMGAFDAGHRLYARAVLQGAVQKAARDSGLESAVATTIDTKLRAQVRSLHRNLTQTCVAATVPRICISRRSYRSFTRAAAPAETFTDSAPIDGICNRGEPWIDINGNGTRDADIGVAGQGGAQDTVMYSVRMVYPPVTPVGGLFGLIGNVDITARTVFRNQPYNDQGTDAAPITRNCV